MEQAVGKIVDFECHAPPPRLRLICTRCIMLERAIREHQRAHEAARSFADEGQANLDLWAAIGI